MSAAPKISGRPLAAINRFLRMNVSQFPSRTQWGKAVEAIVRELADCSLDARRIARVPNIPPWFVDAINRQRRINNHIANGASHEQAAMAANQTP